MAFSANANVDGAEIWTRQFGTSESDEILIDGDRCVRTLSGGRDHPARWPGRPAQGSVDAFVRKCDFNGEVVWTRQFGTAKYDDALGIATSAQGV